MRPSVKVMTEITAERKTTFLKDFAKFMAIKAGKMIKLEIRSAPRRRMPRTTTIEQIAEKIMS